MEFQAKELRFVILGLKKLLAENTEKLQSLDSESDDFVYAANDASLIEIMIGSLEEEYERRFGSGGA